MKLVELVKELLKENAIKGGVKPDSINVNDYLVSEVIVIDGFLIAVIEHEALYPYNDLAAAALAKLKVKKYKGLIILSKWIYENMGLENDKIKVLLRHEMGHILAGFKERKGDKVRNLKDLARWYVNEEVRANKKAGILNTDYHANIIEFWKKALKGGEKELKMLATGGFYMLDEKEKEKVRKEVKECLNL